MFQLKSSCLNLIGIQLFIILISSLQITSAGSCKEASLCCNGRDSSCVVQKAPINAIIEDLSDKPCYCDHACLKLGDCCEDFKSHCGGSYHFYVISYIYGDFLEYTYTRKAPSHIISQQQCPTLIIQVLCVKSYSLIVMTITQPLTMMEIRNPYQREDLGWWR